MTRSRNLRLVQPTVTPHDMSSVAARRIGRHEGFDLLAGDLVDLVDKIEKSAAMQRRQPSGRAVLILVARTVAESRAKLQRGDR